MENSTIDIIDEEFEDALSFCDLPLFSDQEIDSDDYPISTSSASSSSTELDFFEFSTSSSSLLSHSNSVSDSNIFCGKSISCKSQIAPRSDNYNDLTKTKKTAINSSSTLPQRPKNLRCLSSSSGNNNGSCRKQKVMIGLAKIPAKMELSDLRERHNRKISIPPRPAAVKGGELSAVSGKKRRSWALLRPFRCGAQDIASTMARSSSFSCLRLAGPWV